MTREQLENLSDVVIAPPTDEVALAVAEALLPVPLPPALRAFLTVCDGAQHGEVEVFGAERITEATNAGRHAWQLPSDTLVIGTAGAGRALVMTGGRDEVDEVDDDPWDARTMKLSADSPLDLFLRHGGVPLRDRARWWALPALGTALDQTQVSLARNIEALLEVGIASRVSAPLPSSLRGFRQIDVTSGARLLASDEYETFLLNYRPAAPSSGLSARKQWEQACEAIVSHTPRDRIRAAPVSTMIEAMCSVGGEDELTVTDTIRELAWLTLLGKAREELAALVGGDDHGHDAPLRRLARVFLAGHVPVSLDAAI